jgi:hypothetical protein
MPLLNVSSSVDVSNYIAPCISRQTAITHVVVDDWFVLRSENQLQSAVLHDIKEVSDWKRQQRESPIDVLLVRVQASPGSSLECRSKTRKHGLECWTQAMS